MSKTKKVRPLSQGALDALGVLQNIKVGTIIDIKNNGLENVNSSQLTALETRGLVKSELKEIEVVQVVRRTVKEYTITDSGLETNTSPETD